MIIFKISEFIFNKIKNYTKQNKYLNPSSSSETLIPLVEKSENQFDKSSSSRNIKMSSDLIILLEDYFQSPEKVNSIKSIYSWRNSSLFSIFGAFFFCISLICFILWISMSLLMGYILEDYLTCDGSNWATQILPTIVGLSFGIGGWIFLLFGLFFGLLFICWNVRKNCYLVAVDDEIVYLTRNWITGNIKISGSLIVNSYSLLRKNSYFKFSSTFKILFLFKWHPNVIINEDIDSESSISIPVFYSDAQVILDWLCTTFNSTNSNFNSVSEQIEINTI